MLNTPSVALATKRTQCHSKTFTGPTAVVDISIYVQTHFFTPDQAKAYDLGDDLYILIWEEGE